MFQQRLLLLHIKVKFIANGIQLSSRGFTIFFKWLVSIYYVF